MDLVLAVLNSELSRSRRRRAFFGRRLALPALAALAVLAGHEYAEAQRVTTMGLTLFTILSRSAILVAALVPACAASAVFARDRERRSLGLLLLGNIVPWQYVTAHLIATVTRAALLVLSVLPMLIVCVGLGGIAPLQVFHTLSLVLSTVVLSTALGLFVSILNPNPRTALTWAFLSVLFLFGGVPGAIDGLSRLPRAAPWAATLQGNLLPVLSPVAVLERVLNGQLTNAAAPFHVYAALAAALLVTVTFLLFPRMARTIVRERRSRGAHTGAGTALASPLFRQRRRGPTGVAWAGCAGVLIGSLVLHKDAVGSLRGWPYTGLALAAACFGVLLLFQCCRVLAGERNTRAFELLLLSDLTPEEIVFGNVFARARGLSPWLLAVAGMLVLIGNGDGSWLWCAQFVLLYTVVLFCHGVVTLACALRFGPYLALTVAPLLVFLSSASCQGILDTRGDAFGFAFFVVEMLHLALACAAARPLLRAIHNLEGTPRDRK